MRFHHSSLPLSFYLSLDASLGFVCCYHTGLDFLILSPVGQLSPRVFLCGRLENAKKDDEKTGGQLLGFAFRGFTQEGKRASTTLSSLPEKAQKKKKKSSDRRKNHGKTRPPAKPENEETPVADKNGRNKKQNGSKKKKSFKFTLVLHWVRSFFVFFFHSSPFLLHAERRPRSREFVLAGRRSQEPLAAGVSPAPPFRPLLLGRPSRPHVLRSPSHFLLTRGHSLAGKGSEGGPPRGGADSHLPPSAADFSVSSFIFST